MSYTPDQKFGFEVKAQREQKGWSMTEFAAKLSEAGLSNFHPTTVARMERGERPTRLNEAVIVASVLGSALDDLVVDPLRGDEDMESAARAITRMSKVAARVNLAVDFWRQELLEAIETLHRAWVEDEDGDPELHESLRSSLDSMRKFAAEDHVAAWRARLEKMTPDEQRELYKSDPEFRL